MEKIKTSVKINGPEWEIVRIIWALGQAAAQGITQVLASSMSQKPATIKTLLGRSVRKGVIRTGQKEKKFIYHPAISGMETVHSAMENLSSHIHTKRIGEIIVDLIEEATLAQGDINEILRQLEQKQPVKTIRCDYTPGQCECKQRQQKEEEMKQQFSIEDTSCNHHAARTEEAVSVLDGVQRVRVNLKRANGTAKFDEAKVQSEKTCRAVNGSGRKAEMI